MQELQNEFERLKDPQALRTFLEEHNIDKNSMSKFRRQTDSMVVAIKDHAHKQGILNVDEADTIRTEV